MADTGILLRRDLKQNLKTIEEGEFVFSTDTFEHGFTNNSGDVVWEVLAEKTYGFEAPTHAAPDGSVYIQLPKPPITINGLAHTTLEYFSAGGFLAWHGGQYSDMGDPLLGTTDWAENPFAFIMIPIGQNNIVFYYTDANKVNVEDKEFTFNNVTFKVNVDYGDVGSDGPDENYFIFNKNTFQTLFDGFGTITADSQISFEVNSTITEYFNYQKWTYYGGSWKEVDKVVVGSEVPADTSADPDGTLYLII